MEKNNDFGEGEIEGSGWDNLPGNIKNDLFLQIFKEISLVKGHTRSLVLISHGFIELMINALIDHHLKNSKKITSDNRSYPHSTKLLILNEMGILNNDMYSLFEWFRKLRNKAAHKPIFEVTKHDLCQIHSKYHDLEKFDLFVTELICGFWNQHVPIFGPLFAPGITGHSK